MDSKQKHILWSVLIMGMWIDFARFKKVKKYQSQSNRCIFTENGIYFYLEDRKSGSGFRERFPTGAGDFSFIIY